jgi:two-component system chemotaxis response regulator CheY
MAKSVLVVDDSALIRANIKDVLAREGYQVVAQAANGAEAVALYQQHKPDLVTMDVVMPEMSGVEAAAKIVDADPDATIIMVSAMGQQALVIEALQAGAKDFVIKPFQAARLMQAVERALEG